MQKKRMGTRGISLDALEKTLTYGRTVHIRGADVSVIGRKEIKRYKKLGVNLSKYDGVQVVCSDEGVVLTTYRNHDFRNLKPKCRSKYH